MVKIFIYKDKKILDAFVKGEIVLKAKIYLVVTLKPTRSCVFKFSSILQDLGYLIMM